jgi:protein-arginine kinase activator protein McsA
MKCEFCENVARVHMTQIKNQVRTEAHLCAECANRIKVATANEPPPEMFKKIIDDMNRAAKK